MNTLNMRKKNIDTFWSKKAPYQELYSEPLPLDEKISKEATCITSPDKTLFSPRCF